jgi:hypothetical protein
VFPLNKTIYKKKEIHNQYTTLQLHFEGILLFLSSSFILFLDVFVFVGQQEKSDVR